MALVTADAPDLPGLLIGKLWRALGRSEVAVCPAEGGGVVAMATLLPAPGWIGRARVDLDTADCLDRLRAAAPTRRSVAVGPGWHRLRSPGDLGRLDPGLEGWDVTRALLSRRANRSERSVEPGAAGRDHGCKLGVAAAR